MPPSGSSRPATAQRRQGSRPSAAAVCAADMTVQPARCASQQRPADHLAQRQRQRCTLHSCCRMACSAPRRLLGPLLCGGLGPSRMAAASVSAAASACAAGPDPLAGDLRRLAYIDKMHEPGCLDSSNLLSQLIVPSPLRLVSPAACLSILKPRLHAWAERLQRRRSCRCGASALW